MSRQGAVITDVHANLPAVEAVLPQIDVRAAAILQVVGARTRRSVPYSCD